jgi:hypothetical protein
MQGLAVKSIRGDAILFYSLLPNGTVDPLSEHGSCTALKGEKYSATKWVRVLPYVTAFCSVLCSVATPAEVAAAEGMATARSFMLRNSPNVT